MDHDFDIKSYLESRRYYAASGDSDKVEEIDRVIFGVRSARFRSFLVMRYINLYSIRDIAGALAYSRRTALRLLARARRAAAEVYTELYC
ncbi:MAG: hypothetical protein IJH37_05070 [Clostridia bacterium]|nr:hypothetical protein [Clostridia bacterium]